MQRLRLKSRGGNWRGELWVRYRSERASFRQSFEKRGQDYSGCDRGFELSDGWRD
jgi:hypothetical protein